ncbi:hypothetical protein ACUOA5_15675, partial [Escherichia coli]
MESLTLQPIARVDGTINLPGSKNSTLYNRNKNPTGWLWGLSK